jgi:glycosyltransferase involved in cell wall biosynthesis
MDKSLKGSDLRILLIIPCYNEGGSIEALLSEIGRLGAAYDVLVIDDGSQDDTYFIAKQTASCLRLPVNIGIGGAEQGGIKYAYENNYDLCIRIDGDDQHPPDQINKLVERYVESSDGLIIGSRFLSDSLFRSTWLRRTGIKLISLMLKYFYGYKATDPTSGFRLMDRNAMRIFCSEYPYDFPEPASIAIALNHGIAVSEIPVKMKQREFGKSSIGGIKNISYMLRVIFYILFVKIRSYT